MMTVSYDGKPGQSAEILAYLKNTNARFTSSREISEALSISRQVVYDSVSFLRGCGYNIEASRNQGYKLISSPDKILPVEIASGLKCKAFANRIFAYDKIGSTNEVAHSYAKTGAPEGALVIADYQKKGRGRLGRKWHSPPGKGLYLSLILKPDLPPGRIAGLSLVAGLALTRAIYKSTGVETMMKWPNDIMFEKKKLAGILVEMTAELDKVDYLIVGIGVNVNFLKKDFPKSLQRKSTSLQLITNREIPRIKLLQSILAQFEKLYDNFCSHGFKYIGSELIKNSAVVGKRITLVNGKKKIAGTAVGFDDSGGLIVKSKSGLRSYPAGEVSLR